MGSDECVTFHVPRRSSSSGACTVALGVGVGAAVEGCRRVAIVRFVWGVVLGGWESRDGRWWVGDGKERY